ncbi:serine protease SPPA, chloroplastic-like [Durio zibethinus]|uniref:Serine protease SPPA, chloroplastic-like n=1 Tax=Durio zibethinus TaxID=66656 RepID=A0A6P5YAG3_DURZI|nr:serine protease SPPA, chloroplastic-like [Durio zibethinus]
MTFSAEVQARTVGNVFERLEFFSKAGPISSLGFGPNSSRNHMSKTTCHFQNCYVDKTKPFFCSFVVRLSYPFLPFFIFSLLWFIPCQTEKEKMSKLLLFHTAHSTPKIHQRSFTTILSRPLSIPSHSKCRSPVSLFPSISSSTLHPHLQRQSFSFSYSFSTPAFDDSSSSTEAQKEKEEKVGSRSGEKSETEEYPSGEVEYEKMSGWKSFVVKFKMLIAFPWERVRKGSVLTMKLRGQISDQLKSRFSSGLSLPQICENFRKSCI